MIKSVVKLQKTANDLNLELHSPEKTVIKIGINAKSYNTIAYAKLTQETISDSSDRIQKLLNSNLKIVGRNLTSPIRMEDLENQLLTDRP